MSYKYLLPAHGLFRGQVFLIRPESFLPLINVEKGLVLMEEKTFETYGDINFNGYITFYQNAEITYYLPETSSNADLYIYDMQGTQLRSYKLHQKGEGSITIDGGELAAGMYMYTLIADGQVIDTKQMILTKP